MVGPLQKAPGGYTHLFVAIDKFTKWIEAKPVTTITAAKAKEFFQDIVVRFGIPNRIITNSGTQFTGSEFKDWCEELSIKICYASVAHPQSNGQVERANGMVLQDVKSRVFDRLKPYAGKWVKELPSVLWALRTSPSRATGESPFFLTYGSKAVLPTELEFGSPRVRNFNEKKSKDSRLEDLDQLEEARDIATSNQPYISRAYVAITIAMYVIALSPPEIWSFERSKSNTNSLQYGSALTSSVK